MMLIFRAILLILILSTPLSESTLFDGIFAQNNSQAIFTVLLTAITKLPESECKDHFILLGNALTNNEKWAQKMLDATAKPQSGIFFGNIMHVGNYDECLEINTEIQGKYCTTMFQPHPKYGQEFNLWLTDYMNEISKGSDEGTLAVDSKLSYGFCVPKVCDVKILQNLTDIVENEIESPVHFNFAKEFCDGGDGKPYTTLAVVGIVIFSLFATIIVSSSLYEFVSPSHTTNLFTTFSVIENGKKLFSTTTSADSLGCLNGLRVISMMWILLAHGFQHSFFVPHVNSADILLKWKKATRNAIILGSPMAVDTFFTISGLLVVYLFMKSRAKGIAFSLPMFYIHRYLRLTPSLAMVILFTVTLLNYMGRGPFWPIVEDLLYKPCEKNWWSTLIYLQNYIHTNEQCVGQAWYLAVDTQMYFLSPLVLFPLVKWPKKTIAVIIVIVTLICSYVFETSWKRRIGSTFFEQDPDQLKYLYVVTHVRGSIYLMGMISGYYIFQTKTVKPLKLNKWTVLFLWIIPLSVMVAITIGHSLLAQASEFDALSSSSFNSLTRVGWSLALSVIILLCVNGYGSFINSFLSCKIFTVLIRLNYNMYLLHSIIMILTVAQGRTPTYFSNLTGYYQFWGDYAFAIGMSIIWTLAFESPILALEKVILGGTKKKVSEATNGTLAIEIK